ncbi:hypothetical protein BBJ28_00024685 [Nothophytophthora sp. Chile5]|nr:hypothetical protein BBJ28_00024685 [Nothophytophthora sp. Chile5]
MPPPLPSGHFFWRAIWPHLQAIGWETGLGRNLEVGYRIYKPGTKARYRSAVHHRDFFLGHDDGLIDYVLENGILHPTAIWPDGLSTPDEGARPADQSHGQAAAEAFSVEAAGSEAASEPLESRTEAGDDAVDTSAVLASNGSATKRKKRKRKILPMPIPGGPAHQEAATVARRKRAAKLKAKRYAKLKQRRPPSQPPLQPAPAPSNVDAVVGARLSSDASSEGSADQGGFNSMTVDACQAKPWDGGLQLLRDVERHMLEFAAILSRRRRSLTAAGVSEPATADSSEQMKLVQDIQEAQHDLDYEAAKIIACVKSDDTISSSEVAANSLRLRVFAPESNEALGLLQEVKWHLLHFVAVVRRYRRASCIVHQEEAKAAGGHGHPGLYSVGGSRTPLQAAHVVRSIADLQDDLWYEMEKLAVPTEQPAIPIREELVGGLDTTETDDDDIWQKHEPPSESEEEEWLPSGVGAPRKALEVRPPGALP